jgi:hypothetical protein
MKKAALLLAAIACWGCQSSRTNIASETAAARPMDRLVNRVWARADSTGLPGVTRIFLSDSTLVMDSCWETYQLAKWRAESDSVVSWQEGTAEVRARVVELDSDRLVLRLDLVDGPQDEHYRSAAVPFVCPDMPR